LSLTSRASGALLGEVPSHLDLRVLDRKVQREIPILLRDKQGVGALGREKCDQLHRNLSSLNSNMQRKPSTCVLDKHGIWVLEREAIDWLHRNLVSLGNYMPRKPSPEVHQRSLSHPSG
jgi:hypothetical protein